MCAYLLPNLFSQVCTNVWTDLIHYPIDFNVNTLQILPSSGWSSLNHSTIGTGLPSPLSQYKDIIEPSFIGPKVAPVLRVFFVFSSMTRTNAGCTETWIHINLRFYRSSYLCYDIYDTYKVGIQDYIILFFLRYRLLFFSTIPLNIRPHNKIARISLCLYFPSGCILYISPLMEWRLLRNFLTRMYVVYSLLCTRTMHARNYPFYFDIRDYNEYVP